ncbi:hypothetical protein IFT47_22210 [Pseudomonas sp. CFBP 13711]|uniref:hypothetical protein n=1 Tax=unclassified Pseudomonas TaxID=196821 RepID=UPI00177BC494|nr:MULTISPECIES: hypothetical protein [unclassified Pseudomonas]MBD8709350.1 hypothetical protein [Pseudomonas sp. CFBP 13711]MBD8714386.1 hypothetical protein [Pseudomonas sp. CFBP 13715]
MTLPEHVVEEARDCAKLFRLGRDIEGALKMVELIDRSLPLMDGVSADRQAEWGRVLSAILACQERQDWLGVADWLEVEFLEV